MRVCVIITGAFDIDGSVTMCLSGFECGEVVVYGGGGGSVVGCVAGTDCVVNGVHSSCIVVHYVVRCGVGYVVSYVNDVVCVVVTGRVGCIDDVLVCCDVFDSIIVGCRVVVIQCDDNMCDDGVVSHIGHGGVVGGGRCEC